MARKRVVPLFPVAVAPSRLADCLDVHRKVIYAAIAAGHLRVFEHGKARRILVQDAVAWITNHWQLKGTRHVSPHE